MSLAALIIHAALSVASATDTVVVHDEGADLGEYSQLFSLLESLDQNVILRSSQDYSDLVGSGDSDQQYAFENVVMISGPPDEDGVASPNATELLDFVNNFGGNLFLAAGPDASDDVRQIGNACGIEFEGHGATISDPSTRVQVVPESGEATTAVCGRYRSSEVPDSSVDECILLPEAETIGMQVDHNAFLRPLVSGSASAVSLERSASGKLKAPRELGEDLVFVAALEARNKARVVFTGSRAMLKDTFMNAKTTRFVNSTLSWNFRQREVFRMSSCQLSSPDDSDKVSCEGQVATSTSLLFQVDGKLVPGEWNQVHLPSSKSQCKDYYVGATASQAGSMTQLPIRLVDTDYQCDFEDLSIGWHTVTIFVDDCNSSRRHTVYQKRVLIVPTEPDSTQRLVAGAAGVLLVPLIVLWSRRIS